MRIKASNFAYLFIMLSCVRLEALVNISFIDTLYDIIKASGLLVAIIIWFLSQNIIITLKGNGITTEVAFLGWIAISIFSVLINKHNVIDALIKYMPFVSCFLLMKCVNNRNDYKNFFSVVGGYFSFLAVSSFFTSVFFPQGLVQEVRVRNGMLSVETTVVHLLGKANACGPILLGIGTFLIVNIYMSGKKSLLSKIICILPFLNVLIMGSSTAIIGVGVFALILSFARIKRLYARKRGIRYNIILTIAIALTVGVVIYHIQVYFEQIFIVLFNKDVTLSNRTNVWELSVKYISNHFSALQYFIGVGNTSYSMEVFNGRYAHCHNQLLDIIIQSGSIGLLFYVCMFGKAMKQLVKQYYKSKSFALMVVAAAIVAFFVMFITEVYISSIVILLMMIANYSDRWNKRDHIEALSSNDKQISCVIAN